MFITATLISYQFESLLTLKFSSVLLQLHSSGQESWETILTFALLYTTVFLLQLLSTQLACMLTARRKTQPATQNHRFEHKTSCYIRSNSANPPNRHLLGAVLERRLSLWIPPGTIQQQMNNPPPRNGISHNRLTPSLCKSLHNTIA
jgi:hypothetical protein